MTSPVIFSLPAMNNRCAWVLPLVSLPKSSSDNERVTIILHQYGPLENTTEAAMIERCVAWLEDRLIGRQSARIRSSPSAFSGFPLMTSPFSLRSMYQLSVSPFVFFRLNAKIALPFFTASLRSASSDLRELLMASNASEDGKASMPCQMLLRCDM